MQQGAAEPQLVLRNLANGKTTHLSCLSNAGYPHSRWYAQWSADGQQLLGVRQDYDGPPAAYWQAGHSR